MSFFLFSEEYRAHRLDSYRLVISVLNRIHLTGLNVILIMFKDAAYKLQSCCVFEPLKARLAPSA